MKRRKVFIEGATPIEEKPKSAPNFTGSQAEFNSRVNSLRNGASFIRHGSDMWPIVENFKCAETDYYRIAPDKMPPGCSEIWYVETSEKLARDLNRVWFVCVRTNTRALLDMFIRVPFKEVKYLPVEYSHITSMNVRPLDKVRFSGYLDFEPEHNFCYVGNAYR